MWISDLYGVRVGLAPLPPTLFRAYCIQPHRTVQVLPN